MIYYLSNWEKNNNNNSNNEKLKNANDKKSNEVFKVNN